MQYDQLYEQIFALPVIDTHTHMESGWRQCTAGLYARSFFHIAWYFWFKRELEAAGYPPDSERELAEADLPAAARTLHDALRRTRNTCWTRTVMEAMEDLYGLRPDSPERIIELSARMQASAASPGWGSRVCDRLNIVKIVANRDDRALTAPIRERMLTVPGYGISEDMLSGILEADRFTPALDQAKEQIASQLAAFQAEGIRTIRTTWPFAHDLELAVKDDFSCAELADRTNLRQHLGHCLFSLYERHGFNLQLFVGMESPRDHGLSGRRLIRTYACNDPRNITAKHHIFEKYLGITFEIFCGSELNSLDMVQAARIYPNVYPGGLWWFNFRRSVYDRNMQYRVEALPACRSTFVASDARCIEWCYIKILLIKKMLTRFLHAQIEQGWLDEDAALYTARCWLHDTAAGLYLPSESE